MLYQFLMESYNAFSKHDKSCRRDAAICQFPQPVGVSPLYMTNASFSCGVLYYITVELNRTAMKKYILNLLFISGVLAGLPLMGQTSGAVWTYGPEMNTTRIQAFIAQLDDDRNMIFGGREEGFVSCDKADAYDPVTGEFKQYTMQVPHDMGAVTRMQDGRFFICGGGANLGIAPGYAEAEIFDPEENSFTAIGSMTMGRMQHSAVTLTDGRILIVGAWYNGIGAAEPEIYDPVYNTFTATAGDLVYPRAGAIALPTNDGGAVVIGGWPTYGGDTYKAVEYFDPVSSTFSVLTPELLPSDPGWLVYNFTEFRPYEEKVMYDGKYVFKAYKGSGFSIEFALITFDPETKTFDEIDLTESLIQNGIDSYYDMVLNTDGSYAYLLGVDVDGDYNLYLVTVNLADGTVSMPDEAFNMDAGEYLIPTMSWIPSEERILLVGISTSGVDYFHATNRTLLLTPEIKGTDVEEWNTADWQVVPNPAHDWLQLKGNGQPYEAITITDLQGRKVWNSGQEAAAAEVLHIDVSTLPAGLYVLTVHAASGTWSKEVVIVR